MIKRKFIKCKLQKGDSLDKANYTECQCAVILKGAIMVFNYKGGLVCRLEAGEAHLFEGQQDMTCTALKDGTEVILV